MLTPDQANLILIINDYSAKWENVRINVFIIFILLYIAIIIIYIILDQNINGPIMY